MLNKAGPSGSDLPPYSAHEGETDDEQSKQMTKKESYALSLQKACDVAYQRVTKTSMIVNQTWAGPLATAPAAISTMATLFKAADVPKARGLTVQNLRVMDGSTEVGKLPSPFFHTNLQYCSDVGSLAFQDAQHAMGSIQRIARRLTSESGEIANIIDLLEDADEARHELKPEINSLKKSAQSCLENAQQIASKFRFWYLVIVHLKQCTLTQKGVVVEKQGDTAAKRAQAEKDEKAFENKQIALNQNLINLEDNLSAAAYEVEQAKADYDWIRRLPPIREPSVFDERERVNDLIRHEHAKPKDRGMLSNGWSRVFGKSDKHYEEDEKLEKDAYNHTRELRDEAIQEARKQRAMERQEAKARLNEALKKEHEMKEAYAKVSSDIRSSRNDLAATKTNLEKTRIDMKLLADENAELTVVMQILENSTVQLSRLKEQIRPLVEFFEEFKRSVTDNLDHEVEKFLRPVISGIKEGSTKDEVDALELHWKAKKKMMSTAMRLQGQFSAMSVISGTYVDVSVKYIRPAISEMENLSTLQGDAWKRKSLAFSDKCDGWIQEINDVTAESSAKADEVVRKSLQSLQRRMIEAAEDADD